jgi:hypothetical protein
MAEAVEARFALAEREPEGNLVPMNTATMTDGEIDRLFRVAKALAMSGMFKDARQAEQAFAKILLGRDLGLSPTQAMTGIHIVEGKPEIAATTLAGFIKKLPGKDYKVVKHNNDGCSIDFYEDGEKIGNSTFTMEDAQAAGLVRDKSPWQRYPRNMVFARALSNGVKWYMPDVTGGIPVYHEGEVESTRLLNAGDTPETPAEAEPDVQWGIEADVAYRVRVMVEKANEIQPGYLRPAKLVMLLNGKTDEERLEFVHEVERFIVDQGHPLPEPPIEAEAEEGADSATT